MSPSHAPTVNDVWMDMFRDDQASALKSAQPSSVDRRQVDAFLQSVERRALYMLELGTRHREEALDLLQDCMLRFVRRYAEKPPADWPPLFFRVVSNALIDWQRRRAVRQRIIAIWPWSRSVDGSADEATSAAAELPDADAMRPDQITERHDAMQFLHAALATLPTRQRQTFLLREWQGLSVAETALALGVSEGSIKTHLSRAHARLREVLHEHA